MIIALVEYITYSSEGCAKETILMMVSSSIALQNQSFKQWITFLLFENEGLNHNQIEASQPDFGFLQEVQTRC